MYIYYNNDNIDFLRRDNTWWFNEK